MEHIEFRVASIKPVLATQPSSDLLQFGIPLPRGLYRPEEFILCDEQGAPFCAHIEATSYWPDKSLRWGLVHLRCSELTKPTALYLCATKVTQAEPIRSAMVTEQAALIEVQTADFKFAINRQQLSMFSAQTHAGEICCEAADALLLNAQGEALSSQITHSSYRTVYAPNQSQPLFCEVELKGHFLATTTATPCLLFSQSLRFHYESNRVTSSFTLHNPNAAEHPDGVWDLGDKQSLLFKGLTLYWRCPEQSSASCFDEISQSELVKAELPVRVYQESSGGEAWNSPAHVNRDNVVSLQQQGFCLSLSEQQIYGKRVQPIMTSMAPHCRISFTLEQFWQQFPSELTVDDQLLAIGLFPARFSELHELQPGERKTHSFALQFDRLNSQTAPLSSHQPKVLLDPTWLQHCQVLPWFCVNGEADDPIQQTIEQGLYGANSLLTKRERVDLYGWRHFGELYADHEADGYQGESCFISHYNNQYDPIYGLLRQSLLRADSDCLQQGTELSAHVTDIDIYHTQHDKDEYNQGLFWHTDHYQQAQTSTHRTYSKLHRSDAYQDHAGGGGPGGQHCYTTGLVLDYWLRGNEHAKQVVLGMGQWITHLYEGQGTVVELLLAWKNRYRVDLKSVTTGRYPLDRGIGNYLIALLDCYALSEERRYLAQIDHVIRHTVHPNDEIATRGLDDIEETWFYTVFLQAVGRYLRLKQELAELDQSFIYARDCLCHYADWMSQHEQLSLSQADKLEFPNLTWTAQDLRKVNVLYLASYFAESPVASYRQKADALYQEISAGLAADKTRDYTRVLAILMQNQGVKQWVEQAPKADFPAKANYPAAPQFNRLQQLGHLFNSTAKTLINFSLSKELDQLQRRFPNRFKRQGNSHD